MQNPALPYPLYENCTIRGLPITAPFRIHYDVQGKDRHIGNFIIVPFQMVIPGTHLLDFTDPCRQEEENLHKDRSYFSKEIPGSSTNVPNYLDVSDEEGSEKILIIKTELEDNDNDSIPSYLNKGSKHQKYRRKRKSKLATKKTGHRESVVCVMNKRKQQQETVNREEVIEHSPAHKSKRKKSAEEDEELNEIQKPKLVKVEEAEEEGTDDFRRKSTRLRYAGFRPDYQNVENKIDNVLKYLDEDDITSDVDDPEIDMKEDSNETDNENDIFDSKSSNYHDYESKRAVKKMKKNQDPDFDPEEFSKSRSNEGKKTVKKMKKNQDPVIDPEEFSKAKACASNDDEEVENESNDSSRSESDRHFSDSDSKNDDGKPDNTRKKIIRKKEPTIRIHVKLEDHQDKYRIDKKDSIARKDRGKSELERFVTVYACTLCSNFNSESTEGIESHLENHLNGELNCKDCDFAASVVFDVLLHRAQMHKKDCRVCPECGMKVGYGRLKTHYGLIHNNPQYVCKYCPEIEREIKYATCNSLRRHVKDCHREVCMTCNSCDKVFLKEDHLKFHKTSCTGRRERSCQCDKCGKKFASENNLARHTERVHLKLRKYLCTECPFAAKSSSVLKNHQLVHQGVHPFHCDQCSFTCVQAYQLVSHMRTHTGEKPYKCTQCKYAAAWNVQLKEHVKVHSNETAVKCEKCDVMFKNEKTLHLHAKKQKCML